MRKLTLLLLLNCNNVKDLNRSNKVINELKVNNFINSKKLKDLIQDLDETSQEQLKLLENDDLIDTKEDGNNIIYIMVKENKTKALSYFCEYLKNEKKVKELKDLILEINKEGESSISFAIGENNKKAFYILAQYIDKNDKIDINGNNIIMKAISSTKKDTKDDILVSILQQDLTKDDMKYRNKDDDNILSLAIKNITDEIEQTQEVDKNSSVIKTDEESNIEQTQEVNEGNLAKILKLYSNCFGVDYLFTYDGKKKNALILAIEHSNKLAIKFLIQKEANPLKKLEDEDGNTPLALACIKFKSLIAILETKPELINERLNKNGDTIITLMVPIKEGLKEVLKYNESSSEKIDFHKKNNLGEDALYIALKDGQVEKAKLLIKAGANINEYLKGDRLIVEIAHLNQIESINFLLSQNAKIDSKGERAAKKIGRAVGSIVLSALDQGASIFGAPISLEGATRELLPFRRKDLTKEQVNEAYSLIKEIASDGKWLLASERRMEPDTLYSYGIMLRKFKTSLTIMKLEIEAQIESYLLDISFMLCEEKEDIEPKIASLKELLIYLDQLILERNEIKAKFKAIRSKYFYNTTRNIVSTGLKNISKSFKRPIGVREQKKPFKNFEKMKPLTELEKFNLRKDILRMTDEYNSFYKKLEQMKSNKITISTDINKMIARDYKIENELNTLHAPNRTDLVTP